MRPVKKSEPAPAVRPVAEAPAQLAVASSRGASAVSLLKLAWRRAVAAPLAPVIIVILGITAVYFYSQYAALRPRKPAEETASIIAAVGRLMVLPPDEQPTIATVSDAERLKSQPFFANAKDGFKVLIYSMAEKAILYDPFQNKIVEVAPLNLKNNQGTVPANNSNSVNAKDKTAPLKKS